MYSDALSSQKCKCKVPFCSENHKTHYCKSCDHPDSDHFTHRCPYYQNQAYQARNSLQNPYKNKAKNDPYSPEDGKENYNNDSQTLNQMTKPLILPNAIKKCRVIDCHQEHPKHFCKFGPHEDSDHWTKDCPETIELYTSDLFVNLQIDQGTPGIGIKPSRGSLGYGIYFTKLEPAENIKQLLEDKYQKAAVVVRCKVKLGKCKDNRNTEDYNGFWASSSDSCTWRNPGEFAYGPYQEWVIQDKNMYRAYDFIIDKVHLQLEDPKIREIFETLSKLFKGQNSNTEIAKQLLQKYIYNFTEKTNDFGENFI